MPNKRILVIDDDPSIRAVIYLCLSELGQFDTIEAESGKEGLAKAIGEHPDAILLDLWMPQMDGMEVLRQLRDCQNTCEIPVIVLSAIATLVNPARLAKQGVVETIAKPFNCFTLADRIMTACHWHSELN